MSVRWFRSIGTDKINSKLRACSPWTISAANSEAFCILEPVVPVGCEGIYLRSATGMIKQTG